MEIKKLWKVFIFLFLISFLVINWNEVSWIFNYKVVLGLLTDFFKGSGQEAPADYYEGEEDKSSSSATELSPRESESGKEDSLEIPKIEVFAPLIFTETADQKEIGKSLDIGVVHFFGSALPGKAGQTIILGHSAPPGWPKIKYDWIFSRLNELVEGDEIYVFFNNRKYEYLVIRKVFLEKGEEVSKDLTNNRNMLVLISCWPPGKNIRRIAVEAAIKEY